jgi:nitrite reductase/ring-hydroxylating ferredoxin subunit
MRTPTRRDFLTAACACAACPVVASAADSRPTQPADVDVGPVDRFDADGVWDKWADRHGLLIVRSEGKLLALSAVCTHKAGHLFRHPDEGAPIKCDKHGGQYDLSGVPVDGPPKEPLARFAIRLSNQRRVFVDRSRTFARDQWNAPAASIKLD